MSSSVSLTHAVTAGDEKAVSALLATGANVNEAANRGQTPLILAVIFGHTNLVRLLLRAGADPQVRDNLGLNAIDWAQRRGLNETLAVLTNSPESSTPPRRIMIPLAEPEKPVRKASQSTRDDGVNETVTDDEKTRRWLSGLKKRLDEQASRQKDAPPEPSRTSEETPPLMSDADEPIVSQPAKSGIPLFRILLVITLIGAIVAGTVVTMYLYKSNQAAQPSPAEPQRVVQKGTPAVGGELEGKVVSLPEAECPLRGPEPVSGTVTVRVMVDKNGQVYWARGAGGDWLMRGASTEAAMKSTFSPEKLRGRETEGTITYTFKP